MAKIKNTDLADKDAFADFRKSAESTVAVLKEMDAQLKNNLATQRNFAKGLKANNVEDINKLAKAQNEVKKSVDGLNAVERERLKLEETLNKLNSDKIQQNEELKVLIADQRKTNRELAKDTLNLGNEYQKLTRQTNKAQAEFKRLAAKFGDNSKQAKAAKIEFEKLDTRLRSINNAANDGRRDVGRYGLAFQKVGSVLKGGLGFLGITAGIGAVSSVISGAFTTIKDFEQSIADLGAITGATGTDLDKFQKEVLRVSKSTGKGAVDIAKAFQIVGSAQPELLSSAAALGSVTEAAVLLSKAGNIDVPEAANSLALAMNQFGASALEAASYTDILATSQQKGTATIPQLSESLKNVGSVARASGLSFETTNAALQGLAKGGLVGAEAGTKLRTILLRLAKTGREDLNPATQKFSDILGVLKKEVGTVTDAQKLFGEEAAAAALTLINQKQVIEDLDGALNVHGAALLQAEQRYDTIDGKVEKFKSTWDRFVIGLDDSTNIIGRGIKFVLDGFSNLLEGLTDFFKFNDSWQKTLNDYIKALVGYDFGIKSINVSIDKVTSSFAKLDKQQLKNRTTVDKIIKTYMRLGLTAEEAKDKYLELLGAQDVKIESPIDIDSVEESTKATKEETDAIKKRNEELERYKRQLEDVNNALNKNDIERGLMTIKLEFDRKIQEIKGQSKIEIELRKKLEEQKQVELQKFLDTQLIQSKGLKKKAEKELTIRTDVADVKSPAEILEENIKAEEEAARKRAELRERTLSVIEALEQKYFDEQNKRADKQLSDAEKREERLQELADRGIQDASDSLARNQKDQAEAVKKKEELAQKEKNFELALAVFKSFNAELEKGATTGEALTKALVSTSALTAAASSLPVFFEGTEDTGNGGNIDGKGGFLSVLHPNERVVPKAINEKLGGITNDELGELAENGLLSYALNSQQMGVSYSKDSKITKELEKLQNLNKGIIKAIENRPLDKGWEVDELRKLVTHSVQRGSTTIKTNIKL